MFHYWANPILSPVLLPFKQASYHGSLVGTPTHSRTHVEIAYIRMIENDARKNERFILSFWKLYSEDRSDRQGRIVATSVLALCNPHFSAYKALESLQAALSLINYPQRLHQNQNAVRLSLTTHHLHLRYLDWIHL